MGLTTWKMYLDYAGIAEVVEVLGTAPPGDA